MRVDTPPPTLPSNGADGANAAKSQLDVPEQSDVVAISEDMAMAERLMSDDNSEAESARSDDKQLFKLITKILIFDAVHCEDEDQMIRYLDFGYDWLQHRGFEGVYVEDFAIIFTEIIAVFTELMAHCKNQQIVNISTDIVTSISLHFSTAINRYCANEDAQIHDICDILNQMGIFYG